MPLSSKGQTLLTQFQKRYGAKRGKSIFYATENKNPKFAAAVKGHSSHQSEMRKMMGGRMRKAMNKY